MQFMLDSAGRRHSCATPDDFYAAIGYGGIQLWKILPRVKEEYQKYLKPAESRRIFRSSRRRRRIKRRRAACLSRAWITA